MQKCQCARCNLYFRSEHLFFRHRVGPPTDRRCLTPEEMRQSGFDTELLDLKVEIEGRKGVLKNQAVWYDHAGREKFHQVLERRRSLAT